MNEQCINQETMKTLFFIFILLAGPLLLQAQTQQDTLPEQPDEQIIVHREYDENGNLIRYDSTYTFEWHGDTMMVFPHSRDPFLPYGLFSDPDDLIHHFFSDSAHRFSPFNDLWEQEFFQEHLKFFESFKDPLFEERFFNPFTHHPDSLYRFYWNDSTFWQPRMHSGSPFNKFRNFIEEFHRSFPNRELQFFENEQQQQEWEEIRKKYQQEMEEFHRKWNSEK